MGNDILQEWIDKGDEELNSAEYLSTMRNPTPDETICYLCQQAAEKYLKGFLFLRDIEPPKAHDLEELVNLCLPFNEKFSLLSTKSGSLTKYAVMTRYPNELNITANDMRTAIRYAKDIKSFIDEIIKAER